MVGRAVFAALAAATVALALEDDALAEVAAQFDAAFREFRETLPQMQEELEAHSKRVASEDLAPVRKLSAACDTRVTNALTPIQGNECGSTWPTVGGNTVGFSSYCTATCAAKLKEVLEPLLDNADCSSEADKTNIRIKMQWCTRDANNNDFCFAATNYNSFTGMMGQATSFTSGLSTSTWCATGSCLDLNVAYYADTLSNTTLQGLVSAIAKNMCVTLPGASSTCWSEFVTARTNLAALETEMKSDPGTYCAAGRRCQRKGLVDLWEATVPATFPLVSKINSMACLQNEQSEYCYKILTTKVAHTGTMLKYNGETFTNNQCAIKSYNLQQQCNPASCAPWCAGSYDCSANEGQCRYSNCDTMNFDSNTKRACGCKYEIGQFMAAFGCCAASVIDFTVFGLRFGNIGSQGIEDLTTELVDATASISKGFPITRAQAKLANCGWNIDPRCSKGQSVATAKFDIVLDNLNAASLCADTYALDIAMGNLSDTISSLVGGDSRDYLLDPCTASGTKTLKVTVMASPVTSLDAVKKMLGDTMQSGRLQAKVTTLLESAGVPKVASSQPIVVSTSTLTITDSTASSGVANFGITQILGTINGPTSTTSSTTTTTTSGTTTEEPQVDATTTTTTVADQGGNDNNNNNNDNNNGGTANAGGRLRPALGLCGLALAVAACFGVAM